MDEEGMTETYKRATAAQFSGHGYGYGHWRLDREDCKRSDSG